MQNAGRGPYNGCKSG